MFSRRVAKTAWSVKAAFLAAVTAWSLPASAAELAALVMEAAGAEPVLSRDSLVSPGQTFDLGSEGRVTLAYLSSCVMETIEGGRFTVGAEQSEVTGGKVERTAAECLAGGPTIQTGADSESGGAFSRDPFAPPLVKSTQPILLLPGIAADARVHFVIARIDAKTKPISLEAQGPVLDLMRVQQALALGGKYKVEAEGRTVTFAVIGDPPPGGASTFERIVVMQ